MLGRGLSKGCLKMAVNYICGKSSTSSGPMSPVFNPATGKIARQVALSTPGEVEQAIAVAKEAFQSWHKLAPVKRARILNRYQALLEKHAWSLAEIISEEHGKTLDDARGEVARGIEVVEYACGIPELLKGEHSREVGPGIDSWSQFHPLGVVAGITPFNFPAMVPMWMYPMAIACGNTFVLKPSEKDPSASLMLAELATEAGLPDGVLNVVNGGVDAVNTLLTHPDVEAISFVGSTRVAEKIYATGTAHGKRVQALGGAKNHAIVMSDADLEVTANALMGAAFGSGGERCMAISVAVCVGDTLADTLSEMLRDRICSLRIGAGQMSGVEMGPLITEAHRDSVASYVRTGQAEGATLIVDGLAWNERTDGFFLGASLFDHVTPEMKIYQEEIFGPVLCIVRVQTFEEALELVNTHEYGNGACIFTNNGAIARHFTDNVKAGMAGVNVALPVPVAAHSFGGWKRSLFGDLFAYGPDAVRFYTRRKTISQRWPSQISDSGPDYAFPSSQS